MFILTKTHKDVVNTDIDMDNKDQRLHPIIRIAIVLALASLIWIFITWIQNTFWGESYSRLRHIIGALIATVFSVPLIVLARHHLDKLPWESLQLTSLKSDCRPLLIGIGCWLFPASIGTAVFVFSGWTEINIQSSIGEVLLLIIGLLLLVFLLEALPEELIFRGYIFSNLETFMPKWLTVIVQALLFVLFGFLIGAVDSMGRALLFFSFAILLGMLRAVTNNVWIPIGFHLAYQTLAQLINRPIQNQVIVTPFETFLGIVFVFIPFIFGVVAMLIYHLTSKKGSPTS